MANDERKNMLACGSNDSCGLGRAALLGTPYDNAVVGLTFGRCMLDHTMMSIHLEAPFLRGRLTLHIALPPQPG